MQSLLPNNNQYRRDRSTFYLMMLTFFVVYFIFLAPRQPQVDVNQPIAGPVEQEPQEAQRHERGESDGGTEEEDTTNQRITETRAAPQWLTLGSMDPDSPYQMLITFSNQGATPSRIELNTKYRDVHDLSGYLGQIVADERLAENVGEDGGEDVRGNGVIVQVLGHGTPAQKFGLELGDRIIRAEFLNRTSNNPDRVEVKTFADLRNALLNTKVGDFIDLTIVRDDNTIGPLRIILGQYPLSLLRPESVSLDYDAYRLLGGLRGISDTSDPASFLMTLRQVDNHELELPLSQRINNSSMRGMIPVDPTMGFELPDVELRNGNWEVVSHSENEVVFRRSVPAYNIAVHKTYRLQKKEEAETPNSVGAGYEFILNVSIENLDMKAQRIAYQLDGPAGLPLEGGWYAMKMGPDFGSYGIRDLVIREQDNKSRVISNNVIHVDRVEQPWTDISLDYIGVDSLFFQCTLLPNRQDGETFKHSKVFPIRVGTKNTNWRILTNVSFRLWSETETLEPNEKIEHSYKIFAGPKDVAILAEHGLGETISYGWFWFASIPLLAILHFFHGLGLSYAMAIIALTVCVRLLLFPLSRKQAIGAIKMQQIQPELKAIAEKYKDDLQARSRAQSDLFKRHGYHPISGCLPIFIQLPIFIGLYKALSIDAGLYGSPLISSTVRWCNDLSAPDMLFNWSGFWAWLGWTGFNTGQTGLGPYFNLLPLLTVVLFIVQMVIMMPPPTDEQSRLQRKIMQYMMVFMGFLFFKVPSGLCLYFIISTVWGLAERRFIPKAAAQKPPAPAKTVEKDYTSVQKKSGGVPTGKKGGRSRTETQPTKPEGKFAKWWREVLEKAAEQQKLGSQQKEKEKLKNRKKKR